MKSRILLLIKMLVGIGLLAFLFTRTNLGALAEIVVGVRLEWLAIVLVLPHLAILISALKWRMLLRELGVALTLREAFRLYLIGTFFNNFLPSAAGGDVVRTFQLSRARTATGSIIAATMAERVIGLGALLAFVPVALLEPRLRGAIPMLVPLILAFVIGYLAVVALLISGRWGRLTTMVPLGRIGRALRNSESGLLKLARHPRALSETFLLSLLFYALAILTVLAACEAVGAPTPLPVLAGVVPLVMLVGLLPISLNGLGVKEASYVLLLGLVGVAEPSALAIAVLLRARAFLTAALGGVFFAAGSPGRSGPDPTPGLERTELERSVA